MEFNGNDFYQVYFNKNVKYNETNTTYPHKIFQTEINYFRVKCTD